MARSDRARLDVPRDPRRALPRPHYDPEAFGRFSETIARTLGTARFLVAQTVLVAIWIGINVTAVRLRWDPYPFILLNLAFSTQAAYAAPLILLAQNRQADRDRLTMEEDRTQYARALADTEYLTREVAAIRIALGEVATRDFLRSELSRLLDEDREPVRRRNRRESDRPREADRRDADDTPRTDSTT